MANKQNSNKSRIAKSFSRAAERYNSAAVLQQEIARRLIERLRFIKITPRTIVDLGTSTGYCAQLLKQEYGDANIFAIDIAEGMLHYIRQQNTVHPFMHLVAADAQHLPFASNTVDLIFSNLMLQWCPELLMVFQEIQRVLQPGGLFIFSTLGPDTLYELRQSWLEVDNYQHVNEFIDMHDVGDALLTSGLQGPVVDMECVILTYSKAQALLQDLRALGANQVLGGSRPAELLGRKAYKTFLQAYENFRRKDANLPATYEVIYGNAWKATAMEGNRQEASVFIRDIKVRKS